MSKIKLIYSFYRFINIKNKKDIKNKLDNYLSEKMIRGTILLADEGINGSLASSNENLEKNIKYIKKILKIRKLEIKINNVYFLPFNKMKVRLKKEIVSLGKKGLFVNDYKAEYIHPSHWNDIIRNKNYDVLDVRNNFEIDIGKFEGSINPKTDSFRDFPRKLSKLEIGKKSKIAMYCTGGIRCEKASAYLKSIGYKEVVQLKGGIIGYLDYMQKNSDSSKWQGECFVFDNRVTVNNKLQSGMYSQCFGCRHPITNEDMQLKSYKKGVSCKYCYKNKSQKKVDSLISRQNQIERNKINKINDKFKKIYEV